MEVNYLLILLVKIFFVNTLSCQSIKDHTANNATQTKNLLNELYKPLELRNKNDQDDSKENFLPPLLINHESNEDLEEDEEDNTYLDYVYDAKESSYKDLSGAGVETKDNHDVIDENILLHTTKDNLPIFLLEPENTYVVKNNPATLKCRAANALEVYFKCNGIKTQALNFEFVDPQTGVRIIEGEYNVTREHVEEYFGSEKYQCICVAWASRGLIRSQPATVDLAYIKKHFTTAPKPQLVKFESTVTLRCEPPPAAPYPQLYWLKNGAPLVVDDNVHITKEGYMTIKKASILDIANYTCVAENLAGKRVSEPALLTVFVNGGWSVWSSWMDCWCSDERRSGLAGKRRVRSCTSPRPLNGGQPCFGPNVQKTSDCLECDLEFYVDTLEELADESSHIVLGRWSQWSEWSACDSDCLQTRRRKCLTSDPCLGNDFQVAQCPVCVRTSKTDLGYSNGSSSYRTLLIVLSISFLIFIFVIVVGVKYIKYKINETSSYAKTPPGTNYFGSVIKRTLTNQPDLTIHEEFHSVIPRLNHRRQGTSSSGVRQEHLYEVPQSINSYIIPVENEVRITESGCDTTIACKKSSESENSSSSCFLSSGSSYGPESIEISPSLKNNASVESFDFKNTRCFETAISKIVTQEGDWLSLEKCGTSMFVPEGVVDTDGEILFSLEVTDDEWSKPLLQEDEIQLSPIIRCGPKNIHFKKGLIVCFPHCACLRNHTWELSFFQKPDDIYAKEWKKILTIGQETPGTPIFAQVDPHKVFFVCEFLNDFVLVGKSFNDLNSKLLKVALFITKISDISYNFKVLIFDDTSFALQNVFDKMKKIRETLIAEVKTVSFQMNSSNLYINVSEIGDGWYIDANERYQEISYTEVYKMQGSLSFRYFTLHQTDSINNLNLKLSIDQKLKQSKSVSFSLTSDDINCYLNCKRYSLSLEAGYAVNVLENPFNYFSLTKRNCRDIIRRQQYDLHRNIFSSQKSYHLNGLSKSDQVILCKLLDAHTDKGNDWRLLAEKLNLSSYYYFFSNTCSPTENLLNLWFCRNISTHMLLNLATLFREMTRLDCATVVERRYFKQ